MRQMACLLRIICVFLPDIQMILFPVGLVLCEALRQFGLPGALLFCPETLDVFNDMPDFLIFQPIPMRRHDIEIERTAGTILDDLEQELIRMLPGMSLSIMAGNRMETQFDGCFNSTGA